MKIEDIKRDREAGTLGEWAVHDTIAHDVVDSAGTIFARSYVNGNLQKDLDEALANARRIARLPELEEAFLEAVERINDMLSGDDGQAWVEARKFLERFK